MSRLAENPAYEEVQHDEIEGIYDEDVAKIQPVQTAAIPTARIPPNFTVQRFIPPPPTTTTAY